LLLYGLSLLERDVDQASERRHASDVAHNSLSPAMLAEIEAWAADRQISKLEAARQLLLAD
jgi:hypothetical protein